MPAQEPKGCHLGLDLGARLRLLPFSMPLISLEGRGSCRQFTQSAMHLGKIIRLSVGQTYPEALTGGIWGNLFQGALCPLFLYGDPSFYPLSEDLFGIIGGRLVGWEDPKF